MSVSKYGILRLMNARQHDNAPFGNKDDREDAIGPKTGVAVKSRARTEKPRLYKVFLLNDDYTPMEFVVQLLETVFKKSHEEAMRIMLHVHKKGCGLCGMYSREVAETKVEQALDAARRSQHPLQCTMERE
ncbi:MAG: ATP-dependent Clp protease adapter ClpS [Alphaproteobacteria bacterium]|nr:ATP-dependent Clp protease adapter ClpS [Alphaproteobacteria bacterium]